MGPGSSRCSRCRAAGRGVVRLVEQAPAQDRGDAGRAGDQVDGEAGDGVTQRSPCLGRKRAGAARPGRGAGPPPAWRLLWRLSGRGVVLVADVGWVFAAGRPAATRARLIILSMTSGAMSGDDRDGLRVARGRIRVGAGQVAGLAGLGLDPGVLELRCAGQLAQLGQGNVNRRLGVGAGPGRDQAGPQQEGRRRAAARRGTAGARCGRLPGRSSCRGLPGPRGRRWRTRGSGRRGSPPHRRTWFRAWRYRSSGLGSSASGC